MQNGRIMLGFWFRWRAWILSKMQKGINCSMHLGIATRILFGLEKQKIQPHTMLTGRLSTLHAIRHGRIMIGCLLTNRDLSMMRRIVYFLMSVIIGLLINGKVLSDMNTVMMNRVGRIIPRPIIRIILLPIVGSERR